MMRQHGFTLAEVMIAMTGSIVVIGALLTGSISLQQSFRASESYASSQADERRLIDYLARDLRRAIGLGVEVNGGPLIKVSAGPVRLVEGTAFVVTLPAYYRSNNPSEATYDEALPVIASGDRVAYGTPASGPSPAFRVYFRKLFMPDEKTVCFVRDEGDTRQVIVRDAATLQLAIEVATGGESCALEAEFLSTFSRRRPAVSVFDKVMLRNTRID
jgi:type II secretory pathway pseudopilin PulG